MRRQCRVLLCFAFVLPLAAPAHAQAPVRFEDLPKRATNWPAPWAKLVRDEAPPRQDFAKRILSRVETQISAEAPTRETYPIVEAILAATIRHHQSRRGTSEAPEENWATTQTELQDYLARWRADWLGFLRTSDHVDAALQLADAWLPMLPQESPVRTAIRQLWVARAMADVKKTDYPGARAWLDRIETHFEVAPDMEPVSSSLRARAEMMLKEATGQAQADAVRLLQDALMLWPRLPGARDALERHRGTFQTLVVGVPALPDHLSPATAWTNTERQSLALIFERLYRLERTAVGKHYRAEAAAALPGGGLRASITLRRDLFWSNGQRLSAADVRHSLLLGQSKDAALWRDHVELPRLEGGAGRVNFIYRQGLLDPTLPLTFYVVPQTYQGKQLHAADAAEFAKAPLGAGPFEYVGRKVDAGSIHAVFQANPHDLRGEPRTLREIRMIAWSDARKDLVKPLPQLILDAPTQQLAALTELGYVEAPVRDNPQVCFLALNHRKPGLGQVALRRALAHALDRQGLLDRFFRSQSTRKHHTTLNGLLPRTSWAACPAPRVPEELYQAEQARSFAKLAKLEGVNLEWTLKYPSGDKRLQAACQEMARSLLVLLREAGVKADIQPRGLPSAELRKALHARDYDLLYWTEEDLDDPVRLAVLFDTAPDAVKTGGSNYLGHDSDLKLEELLAAAVKTRQFAAAQTSMHALHAHLHETMPTIPLWQLDLHVLMQPVLRAPALKSRDVFARVRDWRIVR